MKAKTEMEEMNTYILNHVAERQKHDLLFNREPLERRKKELNTYIDQIAQIENDKVSYEKEIKAMEVDFKKLVENHNS